MDEKKFKEYETRAAEAERLALVLQERFTALEVTMNTMFAAASKASSDDTFKAVVAAQLKHIRESVVQDAKEEQRLRDENKKLKEENERLKYRVEHLVKETDVAEANKRTLTRQSVFDY